MATSSFYQNVVITDKEKIEEIKNALNSPLKDLAMATEQDEYLEFVYQLLMEANGEKLRAGVEKTKQEHPELVEAVRENWERIMGKVQEYNEETVERLKAENERLEKELKGKEDIFLKAFKAPTYAECPICYCGIDDKNDEE